MIRSKFFKNRAPGFDAEKLKKKLFPNRTKFSKENDERFLRLRLCVYVRNNVLMSNSHRTYTVLVCCVENWISEPKSDAMPNT